MGTSALYWMQSELHNHICVVGSRLLPAKGDSALPQGAGPVFSELEDLSPREVPSSRNVQHCESCDRTEMSLHLLHYYFIN